MEGNRKRVLVIGIQDRLMEKNYIDLQYNLILCCLIGVKIKIKYKKTDRQNREKQEKNTITNNIKKIVNQVQKSKKRKE